MAEHTDSPETQASAPHDSGGKARTSLVDFALVLAENHRILILIPLIAGLVALGYAYTIAPTFTASTQILLPVQQQQSGMAALASQLGALPGVGGAVVALKNPAETYVAIIKSRTVVDRIVERFRLKAVAEPGADENMRNENARAELSSRTRVRLGRDGVIAIQVDDGDPQQAADLANAYVDELRAFNGTLAVAEASQRRLFFESQLKRVGDDLARAEVALRRSGVSEASLRTIPQSALAIVAELRARITAQEVKLASMHGFMTDSNPDLKQAQQELLALRGQLTKMGEGEKPSAGGDTEYLTRYRDFRYNETLFELMVKQHEAARLDEARESAVIQVIDPALPPAYRSSPNRAQIAVRTTLVAFFAVLMAIFVRRGLRKAVADPETAAKLARLREHLRLRRR